jgi:hypothetical protein
MCNLYDNLSPLFERIAYKIELKSLFEKNNLKIITY